MDDIEKSRDDTGKAILKKVKKMLGYDPVGMSDLLHILTHPDVINLTKAYIVFHL